MTEISGLSPKRIVVIGPESTGKSSLSQALAAYLGTAYVPEVARDYLDRLQRPYTEEDLLQIARGQVAEEDRIAAHTRGLLVCDTDLYVLKVWSEHSYGTCHPWILEQIAQRTYDLYLLTDTDIGWVDDQQREHPEPHMRRYFYHVYRDIVQNSGVPWADIRGNGDRRLELAVAAVRRHFGPA